MKKVIFLIGYTEQSQTGKFDKIDKFICRISKEIDFFYESRYNIFCIRYKIFECFM